MQLQRQLLALGRQQLREGEREEAEGEEEEEANYLQTSVSQQRRDSRNSRCARSQSNAPAVSGMHVRANLQKIPPDTRGNKHLCVRGYIPCMFCVGNCGFRSIHTCTVSQSPGEVRH